MKSSQSKNPASNEKESFESLPEQHKNTLYFLAIYAAPVRKIRIQEFLGCLDLPPDPTNRQFHFLRITHKNAFSKIQVKPIVERLEQLGWIDIDLEGFPHCKSNLREQIVYHLYSNGQYQHFANVLFQITGGRYFLTKYSSSDVRTWESPKHPEDMVRELRHLLINDQVHTLSEVFNHIDQYDHNGKFLHAVWDMFRVHDGLSWLNVATIEFRSLLLQYLLLRSISQLEYEFDELWDIVIATCCDPKCEPVTQVMILDYAFCAGKLDTFNRQDFSSPTALLLWKAHQALLCGQYTEATENYRATLKSLGNLKSIKNATLPFLAGIFHALAELNTGNRVAVLENAAAAVANADRVSRGTNIKFPMRMEGCWNLIKTISERLIGKTPDQLLINTTSRIERRPVWLSLLLSAYESTWFQLKATETVEQSMAKLLLRSKASFPWIATEVAEICESLGIEKQEIRPHLKTAMEFREQTNSVSLRDLFTVRDDWELWLESLQALANGTPKNPKTKASTKKGQPKSRLIWRIGNEYGRMEFFPYVQKWSAKSNAWADEKSITMSHLFKSQNKLDYLTEQDRQICATIRVVKRSGYYNSGTDYKFKDEIALEFVGHPLLFSMPDKKSKSSSRIELVQTRPEIAMHEKDGKLHVTFSPPLVKYNHTGYNVREDDSDKNYFTIEESPTRFKVIKLTRTEMQIRSILGENGRVFPQKSRTQLASLLGKLAGEMNVKTDAEVEFADIPEIPAHATLYIHLSPCGEGLKADFFVRPLGANSPGHRPCIGSARILGEVNGKNVQTTRNLKEEENRLKVLVARIPVFQHGVVPSENQYIFESPNDALAMLSELHDASQEKKQGGNDIPDFEIHWPYGEKYSVSPTISFGNLKLSFASAEEWLAASGSVQFDGDSIELQKLLELLDDQSENRFIKLSDQKFLALTNEFRKRLGELKRLSHVKGKTLQLHPLAAAGLEDFFDAVPTLQKNASWKEIKKRIESARDYIAPFPKDFIGDLRDYQHEGYQWLARTAKWGVGCCLADDMGLGKTIQALALLLLRADQGPSLVVAPTSVCFNWEREAAKFAPTLNIKRIQPIATGSGQSKTQRDKLIASAKKRDVLVTSYSLMQQEIDLFSGKKYATVILDESQAIKNPESNRAKAASMLQADFRIAMTGTPIENNLTELWSLFRFLNPGLLGSQKSFEDRFAVPIQRDHSSMVRGTLRRLAHPFLLRRTKSQVLDELPARTEIIREIQLSRDESTLYETARLHALKELQDIKNANSGRGQLQILAVLTRLRQLCCNPKMVLPDSKIESSKLEVFREIMLELKENRHKVLVFSQFVKHLGILKAELDSCGITYQYLDGSTPARERQNRVDAFQSGESDAFLISIKAGGTGLNLTAADYVIHTDPWWNPAVEDQATDRAHRIGQTRPVTVYRLITKGTIEERIVRLHHEKRDIADKLLEGTDQATKLTVEELIDILRDE
jgi:superfamily II DNA or RNA helicase